ncbi:hypothetical protein OIU77_008436 [Salix suchowensis]|uniref:Uncharacterized protein n=1 Tax=Salix suchowensis TaxID=1278906 RepID=A0ABQ9AJM7_9ROSI|nr:hypothetical protein OIU77_008436 [Salix suchowensis]
MAATLGIKTFLLFSLLLLAPLLSSGFVEAFKEGMTPHHSFVKDGIQVINTRKLLVEVLDYDDAGANRRHDPRGRTGAGGGKNP